MTHTLADYPLAGIAVEHLWHKAYGATFGEIFSGLGPGSDEPTPNLRVAHIGVSSQRVERGSDGCA